ncbi:MAG TPA: hypothetical protein PK175_08840 [Syntrophales bacterium]|jgi:hypothetical protein|nr:hypothetical protein [Syntrophales bacterium]HOU76830.1 hypothetical protein [Syntrophales bacterium]HPC32334.1 hypothetical protein [Syntrophales bacterium]HQG34963.1 hypothetical protein [Syntrophales bacterium]HQI34788.1 hypothetical protein [Syntrophales bacterium]
MYEFLDVTTWSVLQWVLVVLAAGFIGQFGKSFAQLVMAKIKARRTGRKQETWPVSPGGQVTPAAAGRGVPAAGRDAAVVSGVAGEGAAVIGSSDGAGGDRVVPAASGVPSRSAPAAGSASAAITVPKEAAGEYPPPVPDKKALKAQLKEKKKAAKAAKKAAG